MKKVIAKNDNIQWGEKTMIQWTSIPKFLSMFPNGKVIHIIRDPRDVLASFKRVTNEPGLRYLDAIFAAKHSMEWVRNEWGKKISNNFLCIRYEDLVADTENEVKKICKMLEVFFEPTILDSAKFTDLTGNQWKGNSAYNNENSVRVTKDGLQFSVDGISKKSVAQFYEKLENWEIFLAELILRDQLCYFNYPLSGIWLEKNEWDFLYGILSDQFVKQRFISWLKTNSGVEAYPSNPPKVFRSKGLDF